VNESRVTVIPLTKNDLQILAKKIGYYSKADFIKKETVISSWTERESYGNVESTRTHILLKRKENETEKDYGKMLRRRFLKKMAVISIQINPVSVACIPLFHI
jgi:hypothetical protein